MRLKRTVTVDRVVLQPKKFMNADKFKNAVNRVQEGLRIVDGFKSFKRNDEADDILS